MRERGPRSVAGLTHFAGTVAVLGSLVGEFFQDLGFNEGPHRGTSVPHASFWAFPVVALAIVAVPLAWWVSHTRYPRAVSVAGSMVLLRLALLVSDLIERATALGHPAITLWWNPMHAHLDGALVLYGLVFVVVAFGSPVLFAMPAGWAVRSASLERVALRSAALIALATLLVGAALLLTTGHGSLDLTLTIVPLVIAAGLAVVGLWQRQHRLRRTMAACLVS